MTAVPLPDALLLIVRLPDAAPVAVGLNCTLRVAAWPGFSVSGKAAPETEKPVPEMLAALTVRAVVPADVRVMDWVVGVLITTLPNGMLVALMVSFAFEVLSATAKVSVTLPAEAVNVAVCAVVTAETVAVKLALLAPAATVTEAGTESEVLLLDKLTTSPPVPAAAVKETVHASLPDPANDELLQETALSAPGAAMPVALMFTTRLPVDELLAIVSTPVY